MAVGSLAEGYHSAEKVHKNNTMRRKNEREREREREKKEMNDSKCTHMLIRLPMQIIAVMLIFRRSLFQSLFHDGRIPITAQTTTNQKELRGTK